MAIIGKFNVLRVVKEVDFGLYLDGGQEHGEILLPIRYVPPGVKPEDELEVFIYLDSEDRIIATTEEPYALVGEVAYLKVTDVSQFGAFMDWGLMKDLFVPFREQGVKMEVGRSYAVYVYVDDATKRIVATSKLNSVMDNTMPEYVEGQEVDIIIVAKTDMGYKVVINNSHLGLLYNNEIFSPVKIGDKSKGYIKKVRPDEKIDVSLTKLGYEKTGGFADNIMELLIEKGGFIAVNDKSESEQIYTMFGMSKKNFKKAIGALYKNRQIIIGDDGIRIVK